MKVYGRHGAMVLEALLPALLWLNLPSAALAETAYQTPSFDCRRQFTTAEAAICGDDELVAHDRAMAWAWRKGWRREPTATPTQRSWLIERNRCGTDKPCLLMAYQRWISELDPWQPIGPAMKRRGAETGNLFVRELGGGWVLFQVSATHISKPGDGLGPDLSDAGIVGLVRLNRGSGIWTRQHEVNSDCAIAFRKDKAKTWRLVQSGLSCGSLGTSFTGRYRA